MSASGRASRLWRLFRQARDLSEEQRDEFLQRECGHDPALLAELRRLVNASPPGDFLEPEDTDDAVRADHLQDDASDPLIGTQLNDYTIEAVVGKGGMGKVYRARETGALARLVAIKVVRRGVDTAQVLARFRAEQATLARLTHPSLATVHRAGTTPDGRPWFAMEFVDGMPLTEYCQAEQTLLEQRVALFLELCTAVQHIHQKGFIHRDLKPSNVLVKREGGTIKLIDFGIARALEVDPDARLTRHQQPLGTPAYMSPEQLDELGDSDTRSDIYALGVVLYELLTDELPFGSLQGRALTDAMRTREPQTPSRRLAGRDNRLAGRHPGWQSRLKGDFDWIVLKALARDRERRYATAAALAEDLQRCLAHRPITARPPARAYLVGRFVRRHPLAVSACVVGASLLTALSMSLWLRGQQLQAALEQAVAERQRAEQISNFMLETFSAADPHENPGAELTARALLDQGRLRAETLAADSAVHARVLLTMANSYRRLGQFDASRETAEAALRVIGEGTARTDMEIRADILASLTTLARDSADYAASAEYARRALAARQALFGENSLPVANSTAALGYAILKQGDFEGAEPLLERAVATHVELGAESNEMAPFDQLASLYVDLGRFEAAEALYRQSLARSRRIHGAVHPETASRENNLAALFYRTGRLAEAAQQYENALSIQRELLDARHPSLLTVMNNLGALYNRMGEHAKAVDVLEPTLAGRREVLGETHLEVAVTGYHLANAMRGLQRSAEAEAHYLQAIATMRDAAGERDRRVGVLLNGLSEFQLERGNPAAAREAIVDALSINSDAWPEGHRTTAQSRLIAARVELALGSSASAGRFARAALAVLEDTPGAETLAGVAAGTLGEALVLAGDPDSAMPLLERAMDAMIAAGEQHVDLLDRFRALRAKAMAASTAR